MSNNPSLYAGEIPFYDAPSEVEGSPYWVDLWASVNGYMIGLQVKPKTYRAASLSIYSGKGKSSQERGHKLFKEKYGGRVFIVMPQNGVIDQKTTAEILKEYERLESLPKGPFPPLP